MIDLHSHVLPGVDDGADDLAHAVAMCRAAAGDGCSILFATPHQRHPSWANDDLELLEERFAQLAAATDDLALELRLGAEIRTDSRLLEDLDRWEDSRLLALGGSRHLLLELGPEEWGPSWDDLIHEISVGGWRPIVAHPELVPGLAGDLDRLRRLVDLGAAVQVTAMSVTGEFGGGPEQSVWELLEAGLVHFVASDCHAVRWRPPGLSEARARISERLGSAAAEELFESNPRAVVEDRALAHQKPGRQVGGVS